MSRTRVDGGAMDRRRFILDSSTAVAAGALIPNWLRAAETELPAGTVASSIMNALPGKRPLIKRSFRPPNYETPVALLREPFTPNDAFYVRWHMGVPDIAIADWRLRVGGPAAKSPREFTLAELRKFETHEIAAVNQCSGNRRGLFTPHVPGVQWGYGAMGNAVWSGVRLKHVLEAAGLAAHALEVRADGADVPTLRGPDFVKSLPMWKALDPDTLIAFEMNGEPLSRWHGFPARLVVPGWTATYWVKSLTELCVLDRPFDGFWMKTAYRVPKNLFGPSHFESQDSEQNSPITDIRVNSLLIEPAPGATLSIAGATEVHGLAWDGGSGIRSVEVSLDGGKAWREATLVRDLGRYAWTPWRFDLVPPQPGTIAVMVRAIARDGSTQADALIPNPAGYHHNVVQKVEYRVA
ncbi:MAG TPA: molybdopterin-dependent oxidoreductase [Steroidobacteraceae bacterium]